MGSSQTKLSLNYNNVKLSEVLNDIKAKSNFKFFYNVKEIEENKTISLSASDSDIEDIMKSIGDLANFKYVINGEQIVLKSSNDFLLK